MITHPGLRLSWAAGLALFLSLVLVTAGCGRDTPPAPLDEDASLGGDRRPSSDISSELLLVTIEPALTQGDAPLDVEFRADVAGGVEPYTYFWDFKDGSEGDGNPASHTFTSNGTFNVSLTVTDVQGHRGFATSQVLATAGPLTLAITVSPLTGPVPLNIHVDGRAQGGLQPYIYLWDMGDGFMATVDSLTHVYRLPGRYNVMATVTDATGATTSDWAQVEVLDVAPLRAFIDAGPVEGESPLTTYFSGSAAGGLAPYSYQWDFGDGTTSLQQLVDHIYLEAGRYEAKLTVEDSLGTIATADKVIKVNPPPTQLAVSLQITPPGGAIPLQVTYSATVTGGQTPYSYKWDFGDGGLDEDTTIATHLYTVTGTFTPTLTVTDSLGARVQAQGRVDTWEPGTPLTVEAWADPTMGAPPLSVHLGSQARGGILPYAYQWNPGDGSPARDRQEADHVYETAGTYIPSVLVVDGQGGEARGEVTVEVRDMEALAATVTATPTTGLAPLTVAFDGQAQGGLPPYRYFWAFGEGGTSTEEDPSYTYNDPGAYAVALTLADDRGSRVVAQAMIVVEAPVGDLAVEARAAPKTGLAPLAVTFTGLVTNAVEPTAARWDFGDGQTSSTMNIVHIYDEPGAYTASLTVKDGAGRQASSTVVLLVGSDQAPQVALTAHPLQGLAALSVTFEATAVGGNEPLTVDWDFGDGQTMASGGLQVSHEYKKAGRFTALVTVTDADGDADRDQVTVVVGSDTTPAVEAAASPTSGLAPLAVHLAAQASGGNEPLSYQWSLGDGTQAEGAELDHTYRQPGDYEAVVIVTDADGDGAFATVNIAVGSDLVPTAVAQADPTSGLAPLTVSFTGGATGGNGSLTFSWDFGDGSEGSALLSPTHTFNDSGTYTVTLTVTDGDGDQDTATTIIVVGSDEAPRVSAHASPASGVAPLAVSFTATAAGGNEPLTTLWDLGDGTMSEQASVTHIFNDSGTYTATLTVTDSDGDAATDTVTIEVAADTSPTATASASPSSGQAPLTVQLTATATGGNQPLTYRWDLGDGTMSHQASLTHIFNDSATYIATLTVTDGDGDTDSDEVTITVTPGGGALVATASASPTSGQAPLAVQLTATASGGVAPLTYSWDFGDGTGSDQASRSHTYTDPGTYTATLTVRDAANHTATDSVAIQALQSILPCSLRDQDCPDEMKCTLIDNQALCVPSGPVGPGQVCGQNGHDDCTSGLICVDSTGTGHFVCMSLCEPSSDPTGCDEGAQCLIIDPGVNAGVCSGGTAACSILGQDCPQNLKCSLGLQGIECVPSGSRSEGQACGLGGVDDCDVGLICMPISEEENLCLRLCEPESWPTGCDNTSCWRFIGYEDLNVGYCQPEPDTTCSLTDQDCPEGEKCGLGLQGLECVPEGNLGVGEACGRTGWDDCQAGLVCLYDDITRNECFALCLTDGAVGCGDGQECQALWGYESIHLGICVSPGTTECSVLDQDCPLGQKCTLGWNGLECHTAGPIGLDETCGRMGWDDCAAGLLCIGLTAGDYVCRPFCEPYSSPDGCQGEDSCEILYGYEELNMGVCLAPPETICSVLDQDCPGGEKCSIGWTGLECMPAGPRGDGVSCGSMGWDDCMAGLVCLTGLDGSLSCVPLCEPQSQPQGCDAQQECVVLWGYEQFNVGVCQPLPDTLCDVLLQDCPDGEKCSIGWTGLECLPAGPRQAGDACGPTDNCAEGLICLWVSANINECFHLCKPFEYDTGCLEGYQCLSFGGDTMEVGYCQPPAAQTCDPFEQNCPDGHKCTMTLNGIECIVAGPVPEGGACGQTGLDNCQAGLICLPLDMTTNACLAICDTALGDGGCDEGEECVPLWGYEDFRLGTCFVRPEEICSPRDQDCPEGEKCAIGWTGLECLPEGGLVLGEICGQAGWDDCQAGLICAGYGTSAECYQLCEPYSAPTGCLGGECYPLLTDGTNAGLCIGTCSPRDQDCPVEGQKCTVSEQGLACVAAGSQAEGESCGPSVDDCAEGLICVGSVAGGFRCEPLCQPASSVTGCRVGEVCSRLSGFEDLNVGSCSSTGSCSVRDQNCPDPDDKCTLDLDYELGCMPAGNRHLDQACGLQGEDDCQAGLICLVEGTGLRCKPLCEPHSSPTGCDEGLVCYLLLHEDLNAGVCYP